MKLIETNRTIDYDLILNDKDIHDILNRKILRVDIQGSSVYIKTE